MRVLQIEGDKPTAEIVTLILRTQGFNVYTTALGEEGIDLAKVYDYDAILLDLELPDISGYEVLRTLRAARIKTPVIVVTCIADAEDRVSSLNAGADDCLLRPFHNAELIARIHAVVRRSRGHAESAIKVGDLTVHVDRKSIEISGKPVHLTGKEYQMLELLALRRGQTLTKESFLNHLYDGRDEPEMKIIDVFVCKLRKKLTSRGCGTLIETVWGRGYVLRDPAAAA